MWGFVTLSGSNHPIIPSNLFKDQSMEINQEKENGIVHLTIKGRLDARTAPEAKRFIEENVDKEDIRLILDLCDVEFISSAGMRLILELSKKIHQKGGQIVLCCLVDIVREVIGSIQLPIAESVTEAIKKFS
jgi:anti-sigma B factor antagonist